MFCQNCGKKNNDIAKFCYNCGSSLKIEKDDDLDFNDEDSLDFDEEEFDPSTFSFKITDAKARRSYYERKAKEGNEKAIYIMATLCDISDEKLKALDYFKKICKKYPSLYDQMGMIYEVDLEDEDSAFECYEKGAEYGDVESIYSLGSCYLYGNGTEKNIDKAIELFEDASDKGNGRAMVHLGELYEEGEEIDLDEDLAFIYYKKACRVETYKKESHYRIGLCYYNGIGTAINKNLGVKYIREAAECGNRKAKRWMDENGYVYEEND